MRNSRHRCPTANLGERSIKGSVAVTPAGAPWHSDGCGFYRAASTAGHGGRKLLAGNVEQAVLNRLAEDLQADENAQRIHAHLRAIAGGEQVDGRRIAGLARRAATLADEIGRTVGLASQLRDPTPVLRRVEDLQAPAARGRIDAPGWRA